MKTGLVTAISAVVLFSGTMVWSAFQLVPTRVYDYDAEKRNPGQWPDRTSANTYFFDSKDPLYVNVHAPVHVELTDDYNGVELLGDTTLFKYLKVTTYKLNHENSIEIALKYVSNNELAQTDSTAGQKATQDFLRREALRHSNVVVRIGTRHGKPALSGSRHFSFQDCKSVRTLQSLRAANLWLSFIETDSAKVQLQADNLTVAFPEFTSENRQWIKLEGESGRVAANNFSAGTFDASDLKVRDFYMHNLHRADVRISASHLARIRRVEDCKILVEGNPEYKWIEE